MSGHQPKKSQSRDTNQKTNSPSKQAPQQEEWLPASESSNLARNLARPADGDLKGYINQLPTQMRYQTISRMQRTVGNRAVSRILDASKTDVQRAPFTMRQYEEEKAAGHMMKMPDSYNWAFAAPIEVTELAAWSEEPKYYNGKYFTHLGRPFIETHLIRLENAKKAAFTADWNKLSSSWNTASKLAAQFQITGKVGASDDDPKAVMDKDTEESKPKGDDGSNVGSIFDESDPATTKLDAKTPFNPANLKKKDKDVYDAKMKAAHTSSNKVKEAKVDVDNALADVSIAASKVKVGDLKVRQAKAGGDKAKTQAAKVDIAVEQAQVENLLMAVKEAASIGGSIAEGKGFDVATSGVTYLGALIKMHYTKKLGNLDKHIAAIDKKIQSIQVDVEVEGVRQALQEVRKAKNSVKKALLTLSTAALEEKQAFEDFSETIEELGKKLGMDPDSIKAASTAAAALPLIEDTIQQFEQVQQAINIPTHTDDSGVGAAFAVNIGSFVVKLAELKGYKQVVDRGKEHWVKRRDAARSGVGMPDAPPI